MQTELDNTDWTVLQVGSVEGGLDMFYSLLEALIIRHIPCSDKDQSRTDPPWFIAKCKIAIQRNHASEGTDEYAEAAAACQEILLEEHNEYRNTLKLRLENLPRSSKEWWRIAKQLRHRRSKPSQVPPIKYDGQWIKDPGQKANAYAKCFDAKFKLPPERNDFFRFS